MSSEPDFQDPTVAAYTALCMFNDWYSSPRYRGIPASPLIGWTRHVRAHWLADRRRPQSAATAQLQIINAQLLAAALEAFYPERDWQAVIKYHMMCHHVHIVGVGQLLENGNRSTQRHTHLQIEKRRVLLQAAPTGY